LSDGRLSSHTLSYGELVTRTGAAVARNLTYDEWQESFPGQPYQQVFSGLAPHGSAIEAALERARRAPDRAGRARGFADASRLALATNDARTADIVADQAEAAGHANETRAARAFSERALVRPR
jgi:hypothetical protein